MPTIKLPDPYVGDFEGVQRNLEALERLLNEFAGFFYWGEGDPENVVTAPAPAIYINRSAGASTTLYVKESGTGNTGWIAK